MVDIKEVAENVYMMDNRLYGIPQWGSIYLINEDRKALVDTGPTTSVPAVLEGIGQLGLSPEDINYLIVTHIHLDHAGGTGVLIKSMPRAQVYVHHRGAKHLVDPTRLVKSVIAYLGAEAMVREGEVVPIPEDRVIPVSDGDVLELGDGQRLEFMDAPGHVMHELCIYESRNRGVFTGDAAGVNVAGQGIMLPSTPPPGFDLEQYVATLERVKQLNPTRLYFAHFDASSKVQENVQSLLDALQGWSEIVMEAMRESNLDGVAERMMAPQLAGLESIRNNKPLYDHLTKVNLPMNVNGFIRYHRNQQEASG